MRSITMMVLACSMAAALSNVGCSSSSNDEKEVGSVQVGAYTIEVKQEGAAVAAGVTTRFILKPTVGGKPTSVTGWVGDANADDSTKRAAVYDPNDGDFDDDVVAPTPLPADAQFWFTIVDASGSVTGSIAYLK